MNKLLPYLQNPTLIRLGIIWLLLPPAFIQLTGQASKYLTLLVTIFLLINLIIWLAKSFKHDFQINFKKLFESSLNRWFIALFSFLAIAKINFMLNLGLLTKNSSFSALDLIYLIFWIGLPGIIIYFDFKMAKEENRLAKLEAQRKLDKSLNRYWEASNKKIEEELKPKISQAIKEFAAKQKN